MRARQQKSCGSLILRNPHENRGLSPHIEVHLLAIRIPQLDAGVPFYGNTPAPTEAAKVNAPLLIQQADVDERINAAWPAYEAALRATGVKYTAYRYPGTQHGFNNDTTPRYDAAAAKLAWERDRRFLQDSSGMNARH